MNVNKKLIILWCVCFFLIILASAVRFSEIKQKNKSLEIIANSFSSVEEDSSPSEQLVPSQDFYQDSKQKGMVASSSQPVKRSPITATAYLAGNLETGEIYLEKNPNLVLPVASMSKLITAIESLDTMSTSTMISITPEMLEVYGDSSLITAGEKFTVGEILYPLLLNSSNIAAEALASTTDRIKFLELMSSYAWEIGMPSSYFDDPSGISAHNMSSANDFFALAKYLYKSRPDILAITKTPKLISATTTDHGYHDFINIHPFVGYQNFLGGKTGHTPQAKDTMLTILSINNQPIAFIVLSSDDRRSDTQYLINKIKEKINN